MNYLLDEIQRGASGGDAPVAWRGGGLPARWFVDPVVLPHCRRENTLRRFAPSPASGRERGCRHCVVSFARPHIGGRNVLAGGMRIRGGVKKSETPDTPGSVACRHADGHPSRPDVAARL